MRSQVDIACAGHPRHAHNALTTGHSFEKPSWSGQGLLNVYQKHTFTLQASAIEQVHEAIATSYKIEPNASPSSKVVLAKFIVLYFKPVERSN